jgi:hypothetical protein
MFLCLRASILISTVTVESRHHSSTREQLNLHNEPPRWRVALTSLSTSLYEYQRREWLKNLDR